MKVLKKIPGKGLEIIEVKKTVEGLQEAVGGYIEVIPFVNDIIIIADEEGKLKQKSINFKHPLREIVGDVIFAGTVFGEFRSLTKDEIELITTIFNFNEKQVGNT